jgi:hypothetical protein
MSLILTSKAAIFSAALARATFNTDRVGLLFENFFGTSIALTEANLAGGASGADGNSALAMDYATYSGSNPYITPIVEPAGSMTSIVICHKGTTGAAILSQGPTSANRLSTNDVGSFGVFIGGSQKCPNSLAALAAGQPYMLAYSHDAAGNLLTTRVYRNGIGTSVTAAVPAYTPAAANLRYGGNNQRTAAINLSYGAIYSLAKTVAEMDVIYQAAREFYVTINPDF